MHGVLKFAVVREAGRRVLLEPMGLMVEYNDEGASRPVSWAP